MTNRDREDSSPLRLMVALGVSKEFRHQVARLPFPPKNIDIKSTVTPGDLHITLRYIGDVTWKDYEPIYKKLDEIINVDAFNLEIGGLEIFDTGRKKILLSPVQSVRKMTNLCAVITDKLNSLNLEFKIRAFHPHVKIAELASLKNADGYIKRHGKELRSKWRVNGFNLVMSGEKGQFHQVLATYPLRNFHQ